MHPDLFHIGSVVVPTYGVVYAASVLIVILLSVRRAKVEGISEERMLMVLIFAVFGMILGSKLFHVAVNTQWYLDHPRRLLDFRKGHVYYGGYIGGALASWAYVKFARDRFLPILDIISSYMPLGLAIHRAFGCMGAGCCFGAPTAMPWGITFPVNSPATEMYGRVPVHPSQLYESALALAIFGIVIWWRNNRRKVPGELFTLQLSIYSVGRFFLEFLRGDYKRGFLGPLSVSQWVSIGMLVFAGAMVIFLRKSRGGNDAPIR